MATNTGNWNSFRQHGSQAGSKLKSTQLEGRQTEPVVRRRNKKKMEREGKGIKETVEKSEDFPWSLNRISQTGNRCKLLRRASICRAGHNGDG